MGPFCINCMNFIAIHSRTTTQMLQNKTDMISSAHIADVDVYIWNICGSIQ
jgi:hypothetical protein